MYLQPSPLDFSSTESITFAKTDQVPGFNWVPFLGAHDKHEQRHKKEQNKQNERKKRQSTKKTAKWYAWPIGVEGELPARPPAGSSSCSSSSSRSPYNDATLIMRFKTRACDYDYMATAERNAYQHLPGWAGEEESGKGGGKGERVMFLSSWSMTFCVCHDECAWRRQQQLLFIYTHTITHTHTHTHTYKAMNCALLKNFPWICCRFCCCFVLFATCTYPMVVDAAAFYQ